MYPPWLAMQDAIAAVNQGGLLRIEHIVGTTYGQHKPGGGFGIFENLSADGSFRSINAGGTFNASGADYAEYERKNATCGIVAKGQVIGFDVDGLVTDRWADAISFGIKSTQPAFIGGDPGGEQDRQNVDRIAYSGKVPVNVLYCEPGDYIVAMEGEDGGIEAEPVLEDTMTFELYRRAVGRVRSILPDGRAVVSVICH